MDGYVLHGINTSPTTAARTQDWTHILSQSLNNGKDISYILNVHAIILHVSETSSNLVGYSQDDLRGQCLTDYVHEDDKFIFMKELFDASQTGATFQFFYRIRKSDASFMIFEARGHYQKTSDVLYPEPERNGIFIVTARSYPTSQGRLLDKFLDVHMEQEMLMRKIAKLRNEEEQDMTNIEAMQRPQQEFKLSGDREAAPVPNTTPIVTEASPVATIVQSIINPYPPATPQGIYANLAAPLCLQGDAGIPFIVKSAVSPLKKRRKSEVVEEEYVCAWCGTTDAPEWRRGPDGPKTLCNACGLRWSKTLKRSGNPPLGPGPGPGPTGASGSAVGGAGIGAASAGRAAA